MKKVLASLVAVVWIGVLPVILPAYGVRLATEVFIMSIFVLSLGFIIGYAGLVSLGHAAFFGLGAYTVALLGKTAGSSYVLIAAAIVIAGLMAFITGWLFMKTSGAYFLMITLAFSQVLFAVFYKWKDATNGADGMSVSAMLDLGFGPIRGQMGMYYFMAVSLLLCYFLLFRYIASPAGRVTIGIKENENRMRALGYKTRSYKLIAYTVSGAMAGYAGAMYAYFNKFVSPETLSWHFSGEALVMAIIGGVGSLFGPPIGAALFVILQNYVSTFTERWPIVMGVIFIIFVLYGRGGIANLLTFLWRKRFKPNNADKSSGMPEGRGKEGVEA